MPKKGKCFKKLKKRSTRDNSTQYVFLDSQVGRNLQDERNVSYEFHKIMRRKMLKDENFETVFVKRLAATQHNKTKIKTKKDWSLVVDVDSSEYSSEETLSYVPTMDTTVGNESSILNVTFDSCSDSNSFKVDIVEYVKSSSSLLRHLTSRSYDNLLTKFNNANIEKCQTIPCSKVRRGNSELNLSSLRRKKIGLGSEPKASCYANSKKTCDSHQKEEFKRYKRLNQLYKNSVDVPTNLIFVGIDRFTKFGKKKHGKQSVLNRIVNFVERFLGWKSAVNSKQICNTVQTGPSLDHNSTSSETVRTENVTTVYKVSISQNNNDQTPSCSKTSEVSQETVRFSKNENVCSPLNNLNTTSLSYPFRQWCATRSRNAHSTGELLQKSYKTNDDRDAARKLMVTADRKKLFDISRGYYPLTKWTLINRLFRQKKISGISAAKGDIGEGDVPHTFSLFGSVKEKSGAEGSKSEGNPVSLTEVKIEDAVKVNGEKRSQDDDDDDCGSGWGYWIEYLMVLLVSIILLLGCVFLVLFWCFYYKKGYNSWKVERDQQFNLHPTLMVGAVVFTGFSVLMYRIGRCSRRLYVKLLHATFHLLAILCFVGGFLSIFEWHNMTNITHFYSLHSWIGFITMGLFGIQFLVGFVSFLVLLCCESATAGFRACLLPLHTTFGLTIFLISIATCLTGLVQRTNTTIGEENYPSLPEEAIVVNALGVALVAVGVAVTYALGRTSLRVKSDCYISERL